jgi:hypothetical protein
MNAVATYARWIEACIKCGGSTNGIRGAGGTWYYLDPHPRQMHNGAIAGRAWRFESGRGLVDLGAWKIAAAGDVVQLPAELEPPLTLAAADYPAVAPTSAEAPAIAPGPAEASP